VGLIWINPIRGRAAARQILILNHLGCKTSAPTPLENESAFSPHNDQHASLFKNHKKDRKKGFTAVELIRTVSFFPNKLDH